MVTYQLQIIARSAHNIRVRIHKDLRYSPFTAVRISAIFLDLCWLYEWRDKIHRVRFFNQNSIWQQTGGATNTAFAGRTSGLYSNDELWNGTSWISWDENACPKPPVLVWLFGSDAYLSQGPFFAPISTTKPTKHQHFCGNQMNSINWNVLRDPHKIENFTLNSKNWTWIVTGFFFFHKISAASFHRWFSAKTSRFVCHSTHPPLIEYENTVCQIQINLVAARFVVLSTLLATKHTHTHTQIPAHFILFSNNETP